MHGQRRYRRRPGRGLTAMMVAFMALVAYVPPAHAAAGPAVVGGGEVSPPDTYPFMAAMVEPDFGGDYQFCGGSLIAPNWVLSAAHCFSDPSGAQDRFAGDVDVLIGRHDLTTTAGTRHSVAEIVMHDTWGQGLNAERFFGDIALIRLAEPSMVTPIGLASPSDGALWAEGMMATVMGWGSTESGPSAVLMAADVPIVSTAACIGAWGDSPSFYPTEDLCAGADGVDSCAGDSGGPLIAPPHTPGSRQIGIVSFGGENCGDPDVPAVYTMVAAYLGWIEQTTGLSFDAPPIAPPAPTHRAGLVDPGQGEWYLFDAAGTIVNRFYFGNPGDTPFMGDWNCDGVDTPGLYRKSDAFVYLRNSNSEGPADVRFFFGDPGDTPVVGDFNANGCDTVSVYRPSTQTFFVINTLGANDGGLGAADFSFVFGDPGDTPVTGDWDGDGTTEVGLHRPSTGLFYWRNTLDAGIASGTIFFGDPGDRFVAGDWGVVDGIDTPALFRPSTSTVYFRHVLAEGNADSHFSYGAPPWVPVAGYVGW